MLKYIFILLLSFNIFLLGSDEMSLAYKEESNLEKLFSQKEAQISKSCYLDLNLYTAFIMVDETLHSELLLTELKSEQPLLTLSYKF